MNLDQLNKWLTLLANLGVLAGIVLVAFQLKENTDATRVQSAYDVNTGYVNFDVACMGDTFAEALVTAYLKPSELTNAQSYQLFCGIDTAISLASNTWIAHREGRASQDDWNTSKTYLVNYLDYDVGRVIWASYKDYGIDPQFFKEVDAALAQVTNSCALGYQVGVRAEFRNLSDQQKKEICEINTAHSGMLIQKSDS